MSKLDPAGLQITRTFSKVRLGSVRTVLSRSKPKRARSTTYLSAVTSVLLLPVTMSLTPSLLKPVATA